MSLTGSTRFRWEVPAGGKYPGATRGVFLSSVSGGKYPHPVGSTRRWEVPGSNEVRSTQWRRWWWYARRGLWWSWLRYARRGWYDDGGGYALRGWYDDGGGCGSQRRFCCGPPWCELGMCSRSCWVFWSGGSEDRESCGTLSRAGWMVLAVIPRPMPLRLCVSEP